MEYGHPTPRWPLDTLFTHPDLPSLRRETLALQYCTGTTTWRYNNADTLADSQFQHLYKVVYTFLLPLHVTMNVSLILYPSSTTPSSFET